MTTKEVYVCDHCGSDSYAQKTFIGLSVKLQIRDMDKSFYCNNIFKHFCDISCLIKEIKGKYSAYQAISKK